MLLENLTRKSCHEWYELKDADRKPENVITLTRKKKEKQRKELIKSKFIYYSVLESLTLSLYKESKQRKTIKNKT